jgi:hypothetical protein
MKTVSLKDAVAERIRKPDEILLNGVVTAEPSDSSIVRLYPNPASNDYYLILDQDVIAVHQWEPQELLHAGVVGHTLYRITLGAYAKIKHVTVTLMEARQLNFPSCGGSRCAATGHTSCTENCGTECFCEVHQNDPACPSNFPHLVKCKNP